MTSTRHLPSPDRSPAWQPPCTVVLTGGDAAHGGSATGHARRQRGGGPRGPSPERGDRDLSDHSLVHDGRALRRVGQPRAYESLGPAPHRGGDAERGRGGGRAAWGSSGGGPRPPPPPPPGPRPT